MTRIEWLLIGVGIGTTLAVSALAYVTGWLVARIGRVHADLHTEWTPSGAVHGRPAQRSGRDGPVPHGDPNQHEAVAR